MEFIDWQCFIFLFVLSAVQWCGRVAFDDMFPVSGRGNRKIKICREDEWVPTKKGCWLHRGGWREGGGLGWGWGGGVDVGVKGLSASVKSKRVFCCTTAVLNKPEVLLKTVCSKI